MIDKKYDFMEEKLNLHSENMLKLKTELKETINKYENMLQQFDPATLVKAIENDELNVPKKDDNILTKNNNLLKDCLKENLNLSFEPNLSYEHFLSSQFSIGILKSTDEIHLQLIKTAQIPPLFYYFSVFDT